LILRLPDSPDFAKVKGVWVTERNGTCVNGSNWHKRLFGHAHISPNDAFHGWVCIRKDRVGQFVLEDSMDGFGGVVTEPGRTLMHEVAHINTYHGHDDAWRREMRRLGQPIPREYSKSAGRRRLTMVTWIFPCGCRYHNINPRKKRFVFHCPAHKDERVFTTESGRDLSLRLHINQS
jgi:hypothetical protein